MRITIGCLVLINLLACKSAAPSALATVPETASKDEKKLESVAKIFRNSCADCHNPRYASPPFFNADGVLDWNLVDQNAAAIIRRVNDAKNPMPPPNIDIAKKPSADQLHTVTDYLTPKVVEGGGLALSSLKVPKGFEVSLFAPAFGARSMAVHPNGIVFVGTGGFWNKDPEGRVYAIVPNGSGPPKVVTLLKGLDNPNGVALDGDDLYVAEYQRIIKIPAATTKALSDELPVSAESYVTVFKGFPMQEAHQWKSLAISPARKLFVSVGSNCNACEFDRGTFATILRMNLDGTGKEVFAKGVRNTIGMTFHPDTHGLWFTDNARDGMTDDTPGDELNKSDIPRGNDFGFPYCHGSDVHDPDLGNDRPCSTFQSAIVALDAHVAPLGLDFYRGSVFPPEWRKQIFIAEHGSSTRSKRSGYRISTVTKASDGTMTYAPFLSGWLNEETQQIWGRPVDVKTYVDGSLLVSDDYAGVIYQIRYKAP